MPRPTERAVRKPHQRRIPVLVTRAIAIRLRVVPASFGNHRLEGGLRHHLHESPRHRGARVGVSHFARAGEHVDDRSAIGEGFRGRFRGGRATGQQDGPS